MCSAFHVVFISHNFVWLCKQPSGLHSYLLHLGLTVDQLITYAVSCSPSGQLVEVLEVFDLTSRCQQVVCGEGGKVSLLSGKS